MQRSSIRGRAGLAKPLGDLERFWLDILKNGFKMLLQIPIFFQSHMISGINVVQFRLAQPDLPTKFNPETPNNTSNTEF